MIDREDLFIKAVVAMAMSRAGRAETEVEVPPAGKSRRIDVFSEPDPLLAAELDQMGLLGEIGREPTMFEAFSETPGVRKVRALFLKQHLWYVELERRARVAAGQLPGPDEQPHEEREQAVQVAFPSLVILSPGKATDVIDTFGLKDRGGGVYAAPAPGYAVLLVVLSELPETRATLLLRLGSKKRRVPAMQEVMELPREDWERKVAEPLLVQFRFMPHVGPTPEEEMLASEIQKKGEEIIQRARDEGKRSMLLRLLRRRFGEPPQEALARIESAGPAQLERWFDHALTAESLREIFGDS